MEPRKSMPKCWMPPFWQVQTYFKVWLMFFNSGTINTRSLQISRECSYKSEWLRQSSRVLVSCAGKTQQQTLQCFITLDTFFGAKESPTCANYALQRTASYKATKYPAAARSVQESFYRDDYLKSSGTIQKAKKKAQKLECLLRLGGFNLTKFVSNVHVVAAPNWNKKIIGVKVIASDNETSHVSDLKWNHQSDTLVVSWGTSME